MTFSTLNVASWYWLTRSVLCSSKTAGSRGCAASHSRGGAAPRHAPLVSPVTVIRSISRSAMRCQGALCEPRDARQNLVGAFRPNERLAVGIAGVEELPDGSFQASHAPMRPGAELFVRQLREPAFHQVEPRRVGRREMQMEAWAFGQPPLDQWRFVGAVVVRDEVDLAVRRHGRVDQVKKLRNSLDRWQRVTGYRVNTSIPHISPCTFFGNLA